MQIKICGITRPEDAQKASALGADAVGLVFWSGSQRAVSVDQAQVLCRELAPFVTVTALLVNATANELAREGERIQVDAFFRTSLPNVYAGGDCVNPGQDLTVQAVQETPR